MTGVSVTSQFVWSSLSGAVGARFPAASPVPLGTVFTLFVATQTLAQFPAGRIRDRYSPRNVRLVAAVLLAVGSAGIALAGLAALSLRPVSVGPEADAGGDRAADDR